MWPFVFYIQWNQHFQEIQIQTRIVKLAKFKTHLDSCTIISNQVTNILYRISDKDYLRSLISFD